MKKFVDYRYYMLPSIFLVAVVVSVVHKIEKLKLKKKTDLDKKKK